MGERLDVRIREIAREELAAESRRRVKSILDDSFMSVEAHRDNLKAQIKYLGDVIMRKVDGEPSRNESAVDCAVRLLCDREKLKARLRELEPHVERLEQHIRDILAALPDPSPHGIASAAEAAYDTVERGPRERG